MDFLRFSVIYLLLVVLSPAHATVKDYVERIKSDPNALYAFFKEMPKGGELHYHFSGSAYAETMLSLASTKNNYCLNPTTFTISVSPEGVCHDNNVTQLTNNSTRYNQTIRSWSMKNFVPGEESGEEHFFNTFSKFHPLIWDFGPQLLANMLSRAANQHELYMEIMAFALEDSARYAKLIESATTFADKKRILLANQDLQSSISQSVRESETLLKKARQVLGCDANPKKAACGMTVKFQYFADRDKPLNHVFAQVLAGFVAASQSKNIVAVNLVAPEDGVVSLRDYHEQMKIFNFLHEAYPTVHISLHAGELAPEAVIPAALRFHIREAMMIGRAERIGHGVDIGYEDQSDALMHQMAKQQVAVEINLTSNHAILNVFGKNHPLNDYLNHQVPVLLSTDDEGILRTDLTRQYVEAIENHHLDYSTLKAMNRNTLRYSFLPGKSLWVDTYKDIRVPACHALKSVACKQYIQHSEKAKLEWTLEDALALFESRY